MSNFSLHDLEMIIGERARSNADESWTAKLIAMGINKAAEKFGEEAIETVVAAVGDDQTSLTSEAADTLYHLLIVLHMRGISLDEVLSELNSRTARSGIAEKASRKSLD